MSSYSCLAEFYSWCQKHTLEMSHSYFPYFHQTWSVNYREEIEAVLLKERGKLIQMGIDCRSIRLRNSAIYVNGHLHGRVTGSVFTLTSTLGYLAPHLSTLSVSTATPTVHPASPSHTEVSTTSSSTFIPSTNPASIPAPSQDLKAATSVTSDSQDLKAVSDSQDLKAASDSQDLKTASDSQDLKQLLTPRTWKQLPLLLLTDYVVTLSFSCGTPVV